MGRALENHITHSQFRSEVSPLMELASIISKFKSKPTGFQRQVILAELYHSMYIERSGDNSQHPWTLVLTSPIDTYGVLNPLDNRIREFRLHKVGERFHTDLTDFLNMPRHMVLMMINACVKSELLENETVAKVKNDLDFNRFR